ncbi:ABC transporter permease [Paenibacillus sp. LMG 31456]|uniref:ABC transporter permease n=1 Tax=Paenibacillus foliorum TaxID=2654974 RepID=A0A972GUC7_9BACL|nr:ABC transporter permease [Paenibacillus foliorum]NOU96335.1 ABC transporter permease [Paenibacillus foliorum]
MKTEIIKSDSLRSQLSMSSLKRSGIMKIYATLFLLYAVSGMMQPHFFSVDHVMQLLVIASFLGILAVGQTLVILTGGIDLSVAYMLNLGAVLMTQVTIEHGGFIALLVMLTVGIMVGILNGLGVAYLNISPIIMTLAMSSILKSITYVYSNGNPKGASPEWLRYLGTGTFMGIKIAVLVWIVLSIVVILLLSRSTFGRKLYAIGTNANVAYLSGIRTKRMTILVYMLSGLFAVLAGMMSVGFYGRSFLGMGDTLLLPSIAAVVIGGTSIMGGRGGYAGTIAGAVIIYVLMSILTVIEINDAGRQIIYGLVILIVLFMYGRGKSAKA